MLLEKGARELLMSFKTSFAGNKVVAVCVCRVASRRFINKLSVG